MADVEALCMRVIVIHHGALLYDGDLAGLIARFAPRKTIVIDLEAGAATPDDAALANLAGGADRIVETGNGRISLGIPRTETAAVTTRLLASLPVVDLVVEEPPIDEVIDLVFAGGPTQEPGE